MREAINYVALRLWIGTAILGGIFAFACLLVSITEMYGAAAGVAGFFIGFFLISFITWAITS